MRLLNAGRLAQAVAAALAVFNFENRLFQALSHAYVQVLESQRCKVQDSWSQWTGAASSLKTNQGCY